MLALPGDGWASRTHARVAPRGGPPRSDRLRNGTTIDGRRVTGTARWRRGRCSRSGSALFVCDVGPRRGDDPPPPADFAARDARCRPLARRMVRLADSDASVLIRELGGGKTRIAPPAAPARAPPRPAASWPTTPARCPATSRRPRSSGSSPGSSPR
ncbi:MAG: hypothetical protein R3F43_13455 [bacterium]